MLSKDTVPRYFEPPGHPRDDESGVAVVVDYRARHVPLPKAVLNGDDPVKTILTGDDIDLAFQSGKKEISVGPDDIITGIAQEKAEQYGIRLVPQAQGGAGVLRPEPWMPAGKSERPFETSSETLAEPPFDMQYWRKQFPILSQYIHVANCSQAPQSTFTHDAALQYLESWNQMGMDWDRWMEEVNQSKAEFANIIHADPEDIAIGTSVSELTSAVASSLPLNTSRKKIVVTEAEFPTVGLIWQAQEKYGFQVRFLPVKSGAVDPKDYDRYVDQDTIITSACDTYYYNGFRQDLKTIIPKIHEKGSLVFVDAYQGLGTHPLDVKELDIDFLATGNLKYLLGVPGIAFLYVKKELVEYLHPSFTGWFGQENPFAFDIHRFVAAKGARRFDNGTPPVPTAYIARAGMKIINTVGVENIYRWTNALSEYCIQGALARGLEMAGPTDLSVKAPNTAIRVPGDSHDFELALRERGIIASARNDVVRVAPHFFITRQDLDCVLDAYVDILCKDPNSRISCDKKKCWNLA
jgi:selenocysteine lyase/cysteine desulfurase